MIIKGIDVVFAHISRQETVAWYRDVLGLELLYEDGHRAEFETSDAVRFALDHVGDHPSEVERQRIMISFRVRDLQDAISALQVRGVVFHEGATGIVNDVGPSLVATFRDPDGNWLQISQRKRVGSE